MMDTKTAEMIQKAFRKRRGIELSILEVKAMELVPSDEDTEVYGICRYNWVYVAKVYYGKKGKLKKIHVGETKVQK